MKKNILNWLTIMLMAFVSVSFVACGSDDDAPGGGETPTHFLIGTWTSHDHFYQTTSHVTFNTDGTYFMDVEQSFNYSGKYYYDDGTALLTLAYQDLGITPDIYQVTRKSDNVIELKDITDGYVYTYTKGNGSSGTTTSKIPAGTYYSSEANDIIDRVNEHLNMGDINGARDVVSSNNDGYGAANAAIEIDKNDRVAWISVYSSTQKPGSDAIIVETKNHSYQGKSFTAYYYLYEHGYEYDSANRWYDAIANGFAYSNGVVTNYYIPKKKTVTYKKVK